MGNCCERRRQQSSEQQSSEQLVPVVLGYRRGTAIERAAVYRKVAVSEINRRWVRFLIRLLLRAPTVVLTQGRQPRRAVEEDAESWTSSQIQEANEDYARFLEDNEDVAFNVWNRSE